jgi:tetratricopeptide (TPR) repeat protein
MRLAEALAHAHSEQILHGDVKPSNILISERGEPLLMDFNLSGNAALETSARGGTLPYMPPEQLEVMLGGNGRTHHYDERSDVFSLGVVLFELLTGKLPFAVFEEQADHKAAARDLLETQKSSAPALQLTGQISCNLRRIVAKCISFRPGERFRTAHELQAALERELRPVSRLLRRSTASARTKLLVFGAAVLSGVALLAYSAFRQPEKITYYDQAIAFQSAGKLKEAHDLFEQAVALDPAFVEARIELGRTALALNRPEEAKKVFWGTDSSRTDPRFAAYVGYTWSSQDFPVLSIPWYERAIALGSKSGAVYNNLAVAYDVAGKLDRDERNVRIESNLEKALERLPEHPTVKLNWIIYDESMAQSGRRHVSERTLRFAAELAAQFPSSGDIQELAARAFVLSGTPDHLERSAKLLAKAAALGCSPPVEVILADAHWSQLQAIAEFDALIDVLRRKATHRVGSPKSRFIEPERFARPADPS